MAVSLNPIGRRGPMLLGLLATGSLFAILALQHRAGDNEARFGQDTKVFYSWVRQYLVARWTTLDQGEHFPHDDHYIRQLISQLNATVQVLSGEERRIVEARVAVLEGILVDINFYIAASAPLRENDYVDLHSAKPPPDAERRIAALHDALNAIARLEETEESLNAAYTSQMRERGISDWKIEREFRFIDAPYLPELRESWRTLLFVRKQEVELLLDWFELLKAGAGESNSGAERNEQIPTADPGGDAAVLRDKIRTVRERQLVLIRKMRFYQTRRIDVL